MKKPFLTALICLVFLNGSAQTIILNGQKSNRPLRWEDFSGTPDYNSPLFAYTYWYVSYKWPPFAFRGDTVNWKVEVTLELEKRSWHKPEKVSDSLLAHEQGHFTIGWLFARAFQQRVNRTVFFRNNYESHIASIFKEELEKYTALERRYDKETSHFTKRAAQQKWEEYFRKELAAAGRGGSL